MVFVGLLTSVCGFCWTSDLCAQWAALKVAPGPPNARAAAVDPEREREQAEHLKKRCLQVTPLFTTGPTRLLGAIARFDNSRHEEKEAEKGVVASEMREDGRDGGRACKIKNY